MSSPEATGEAKSRARKAAPSHKAAANDTNDKPEKAVQTRVSHDYAERLTTHARSLGMSDAAFIKAALDAYIADREKNIEAMKAKVREKHEAALARELEELDRLAQNPTVASTPVDVEAAASG